MSVKFMLGNLKTFSKNKRRTVGTPRHILKNTHLKKKRTSTYSETLKCINNLKDEAATGRETFKA